MPQLQNFVPRAQFSTIQKAIPAAISLVLSGSAFATLTTYRSEPTFLSAAGSVIVESFETSSGSGLTSLQTPAFLLSHSGSAFSVLTSPSPFGTFANDGTHYLEEATALVSNEFQFSNFGGAISAFGLYITDYGDFGTHPLILTVNLTRQFEISKPSGVNANGSLLYFGVVATNGESILNVSLRSDDAIGIDKVSISPVTETPSVVMVLAGLTLMQVFFRRRPHNTCAALAADA